MVDEIKLHKQRARGQEAQRLWENSMIQEFFTAVEETVRGAWKDSQADEAEVRERAYLMLRLHENYKQQFKSYMYTGKIAAAELLDIEKRKEMKR